MYVLGGVNPVHLTVSTQFILCISQSRHKARGGDMPNASARRHRMVRRKDHRQRIDVKELVAKATRPYQHSLIKGLNLGRCHLRKHSEHVILPSPMLDYAYRYEYLQLHTFTYICDWFTHFYWRVYINLDLHTSSPRRILIGTYMHVSGTYICK